MARVKRDPEALQRCFTDYDRHVEIVCCWNSWYEDVVPGCSFDRYPCRHVDGVDLTPDFAVDFENGYTLIGEVCLLPNQEDGFRRSVEQAGKYTGIAGGAEVLMLVPFDIAAESELRISRDQLLADDDPVVLLAYARNPNVAHERWEFARVLQKRTARVNDDFLGGDLSLGQRLCDQLKPLRVPIEYCFKNKLRHPFINDEPPSIYSAVYLCQKVAPLALSKEEFLLRRLDDEDLVIEVDADQLVMLCETELGVKMRVAWVKDALEILEEARLAKRVGQRYEIQLGKLRITHSGSRDLMKQIAERAGGPSADSEEAPPQEALQFD